MPTLKEMAQESGLSQSTLSRALNHCPGTGEEAAQVAAGLRAKYQLNPFSPGRYAVGIILPEGPKYFWEPAWLALREALRAAKANFRPAFIESIHCGELALGILREMEESGFQAVIMPHIPSCARYIAGSKMRFFFLCEPSNLVNTFSFCSDGYRDGQRLAQLFREHYPERRQAVIVCGNTETSVQRKQGFSDILGQERILGEITVPANRMSLFPSILAREIAERGLLGLDALCCLNGVTHKAALAIHKLRRLDDAVVIGFEMPSPGNQYMQDGTITMLMTQNISGQAEAAAKAAALYAKTGMMPSRKYTLIESSAWVNTAKRSSG